MESSKRWRIECAAGKRIFYLYAPSAELAIERLRAWAKVKAPDLLEAAITATEEPLSATTSIVDERKAPGA